MHYSRGPQMKDDQILDKIKHVLMAFHYKNQQIGYAREQVSLVNFLLIFGSEEAVFKIIDEFFENLFP